MIMVGPRVGVSVEADRPWRFWIGDSPFVSDYKRSPRAPSAITGYPSHDGGSPESTAALSPFLNAVPRPFTLRTRCSHATAQTSHAAWDIGEGECRSEGQCG